MITRLIAIFLLISPQVSIEKLWDSFREAQRMDRPKDEVSILEQIKQEARRQHSSWDYFQACQEQMKSECRRNWKLRDSLTRRMEAELDAFGESIITIFTNHPDSSYVREHEKQLRRGFNPEFHKHDWMVTRFIFSDALLKEFKSDWDYACWVSGMYGEFKGRYPLDALAGYNALESDAERQAYIRRYESRSVSLLARQDLLGQRMYGKELDSDGYKALKADCEQFEKDRRSFSSGSEKLIAEVCNTPKSILEELDSRDIRLSIDEGVMNVVFRNTDKMQVHIKKDGKSVWERVINNPRCSFYAFDTTKVIIPDLPDGSYELEGSASGKLSAEASYQKYTLAIALRRNSDGTGIYVADRISGKPLENVTLNLYGGSGRLIASCGPVSLGPGFTQLPSQISSAMSGNESYSLEAQSGKRLSKKRGVSGMKDIQDLSERQTLHATILTDRSAFTPGETVSFKCIAYEGTFRIRAAEGRRLSIRLTDAEGKEVGSMIHKTSAYGSAAGSFLLPEGRRGGRWTLAVEDEDRRIIASRTLTVDEFVLPTFALDWDRLEEYTAESDTLSASGTILAYSGHSLSASRAEWKVTHNGSDWRQGTLATSAGGRFRIDFPADKKERYPWWDNYAITVRVTDGTGETREFSQNISIRHMRETSEPEKPKSWRFEDIDASDRLGTRFVAGGKATWAALEVHGSGKKLLHSETISFDSETTVSLPYEPSWPGGVEMTIVCFQDGKCHTHNVARRREVNDWDLDLSFSRFLDSTAPGTGYTFTIRTAAGVECAATVFDKSTETVRSNTWSHISGQSAPLPSIHYDTDSGTNASGFSGPVMIRGRALTMSKSAMVFADQTDGIVAEEAMTAANGSEGPAEDIYIRENFANTIAWEPFLRSDENGRIQFSFNTADKLSTYFVQLFAHDPAMHNAVLRREMKVTIPVKIAIVQPQFLYDGDSYTAAATVSSAIDAPVSGRIVFNDGESIPVTIPALGSATARCSIPVPESGDLILKVVFIADNKQFGSDGVKVSVPVRPAFQTITEAHSTLLRSGADREELEAELRAMFRNMPGSTATASEISIIQMIRQALPEEITPRDDDAVSLASAILARKTLSGISEGISPVDSASLKKLLALRGQDGGFSWRSGLQPSPRLTALVLEMLNGILPDPEPSVKYLDKCFFAKDPLPYWRGWLSMGQYMYVRSMYPDVSFTEKVSRDMKKAAKAYLIPRDRRGLNGQILDKARRILTLRNLISGGSLAREWGLGAFRHKKMERSEVQDIESLKQYAVEHRGGGIFFPNAVMPWRGLLESEVYAHVLLARLFGEGEIADGIRLWLMIQKETQQWGQDPAFIEAVAMVLEGREELLQTKVLALRGSARIPFADVREAGNGMSISCHMADSAKTGDKLTIEYRIRSDENRSFVKMSLPYPAGLRPVRDLSGCSGWNSYREVRAGVINYWFDSYPEETTTIREEFYVEKEGRFQMPAPEIVCLYADHYRANSAAQPPITIEP